MIFIYTTGDKEHGMGHVLRCLTLADELQRREITFCFTTEYGTAGAARLKRSGWLVSEYGKGDLSWATVFIRRSCDMLIIDVENGPDVGMLRHVARFFRAIVVIGGSGQSLYDPEAVRRYAHLWIIQSVKPVEGAHLSGVEYLMIDPLYAAIEGCRNGPIVVSLGGSDPHHLTAMVVNGLQGLGRQIIAINGPAAEMIEVVSENCQIIHEPPSLLPYLDGASLLVGALGMTAYEAAAAGVPSLLTNWTTDHELTALELERRNVCINLGRWDRFDEGLLRELAEQVIEDEARWTLMHAEGKTLVDGGGVGRVVDEIERLEPGGPPLRVATGRWGRQ